jgi:glycosyltransferase involved in cell wall biosynthesis
VSVVFNGRFLAARPTGVQRVAHQLIRALDSGLARGDFDLDGRAEIVCPAGVDGMTSLSAIAERRGGMFTGQPWEQFDLPRLARGRLLVNLCNLGPLGGRRQVTMIHDAQVYISPQSYSRAFAEWYRFALPRIGAASRKVLTVSEFSREMLEKHGVAPREKIEVIHNGVDHIAAVEPDAAILARLRLQNRPYVVALASAQAHKNLRVVCEAFARRDLAALRLVLVGSVTIAELERAGIPVPETVLFAGRVSDGELRALLESAIAYACPSITEGFGLPPLEAMYVGCPAVVAPRGALPEVCGEAALYAAPDDPKAWTEAILSLAEDKEARATVRAKGAVQASKFRWERAARQLHDVLRVAA